MIHTDEDDEFERIKRENQMKGQPYYWEADAIKAAVLIEREACARECEGINSAEDYYGERPELVCAEAIRARGQA